MKYQVPIAVFDGVVHQVGDGVEQMGPIAQDHIPIGLQIEKHFRIALIEREPVYIDDFVQQLMHREFTAFALWELLGTEHHEYLLDKVLERFRFLVDHIQIIIDGFLILIDGLVAQ